VQAAASGFCKDASQRAATQNQRLKRLCVLLTDSGCKFVPCMTRQSLMLSTRLPANNKQGSRDSGFAMQRTSDTVPSTHASILRTNGGSWCRWLRMIPSPGTNASTDTLPPHASGRQRLSGDLTLLRR
jgi:hypothetical protein